MAKYYIYFTLKGLLYLIMSQKIITKIWINKSIYRKGGQSFIMKNNLQCKFKEKYNVVNF